MRNFLSNSRLTKFYTIVQLFIISLNQPIHALLFCFVYFSFTNMGNTGDISCKIRPFCVVFLKSNKSQKQLLFYLVISISYISVVQNIYKPYLFFAPFLHTLTIISRQITIIGRFICLFFVWQVPLLRNPSSQLHLPLTSATRATT